MTPSLAARANPASGNANPHTSSGDDHLILENISNRLRNLSGNFVANLLQIFFDCVHDVCRIGAVDLKVHGDSSDGHGH